MTSNAAPIVVIDSGLGGLTVVRCLQKQSPAENIVYFGDTARVPYGSKSAPTVAGFVREIITYLQRYRPKHVVIACNTATALALPVIKTEFPHLSISGVIEPGARAAIQAAGNKPAPRIAVIATQATINSQAYEQAICRRRHHAILDARATPLLVPIIEEGRDEKDILVRLALTQYLKPIARLHPDVLLLGCTHYPVYKRLIARMMGQNCQVIDSAQQSAQDVTHRLRVSGGSAPGEGAGYLKCFVTDDAVKFQSLAIRFLGTEIQPPTLVTLEELTEPRILRLAPMRQAS
jgi:glutamate racemase